jgi:hypothetical protein
MITPRMARAGVAGEPLGAAGEPPDAAGEPLGAAGELPDAAVEPADVVSSGTDPIVGDRSPQHFTRSSHDHDPYARNALTEHVKT